MPEPAARIRDRLAEGDRRTPGAAGAIADLIDQRPDRLPDLIVCLDDTDPVVVSHAAHAAMQLSGRKPSLFDAHVEGLISRLKSPTIWEIGEQLPKILVRSKLTARQCARLAQILTDNLDNRSNIVAACSLQAIVDLTRDGRIDRELARTALDRALASERKALAARARNLAKAVGFKS